MTTLEITLLIAFFLIIAFPLLYLETKLTKYDFKGIGVFALAILIIFFYVFIRNSIELDKLRKSLDCPEYEKVENVYKKKS